MKLTSKSEPELVKFDDAKYEQKARRMTSDAIWLRQCMKYRTKVSSGCGVAFSGLMFVPTFGVSTIGLWISGRTLDIARRKEKIIDAECARRNLPPYEKKKRDIAIPLGISLTVITTVGVIDLFCLAGTSTAVVNGVAPHGLEALSLAFHHPGDFLAAAWNGFQFQGEQFLHLPHQHMAIGIDKLDLNGDWGMSTQNVFSGNGLVAATSSVKAQVASLGHQEAAMHGGNAVKTWWADNFFQTVAQNPADAAPLAGAAVGMNIAQTAETNVAKGVLSSLGLQSLATGLTKTTSKQPQAESLEEDKEKDPLKVSSNNLPPATAEQLFEEALTGKTPRPFVFVSNRGQVMSQNIVAVRKESLCERVKLKRQKTIMCHFCEESVQNSTQSYYRCQECSFDEAKFDICEGCVAGLGCGCRRRVEHVLQRRGKLDVTVDRGELIDIEEQKTAQSTKSASKRTWARAVSGWEEMIKPLKKRGGGVVDIADEKENEMAALIDQAGKDVVLNDDDDADSILFFDTKE